VPPCYERISSCNTACHTRACDSRGAPGAAPPAFPAPRPPWMACMAARPQSMIMAGHGGGGAPLGQRWLWEIVANGRNGIDVDKVCAGWSVRAHSAVVHWLVRSLDGQQSPVDIPA
jgi:hypothetical protein